MIIEKKERMIKSHSYLKLNIKKKKIGFQDKQQQKIKKFEFLRKKERKNHKLDFRQQIK